MRILAAFFAVLFTFINPAMIMNVVNEIENIMIASVPHTHESISVYLSNSNLRLRSLCLAFVLTTSILHILFTILSLYGIYACRPVFLKPLLIDIIASFKMLLIFVLTATFSSTYVSANGMKGVYIGGAFLLTYIVWFCVTLAAHSDTRKLRADFMYWIVEERVSMRSRHNVSVDNSGRSDRSSKGSKTSKTSRASKGSARSQQSERPHSRPNSASASVKKMSIVHSRLSVPL